MDKIAGEDGCLSGSLPPSIYFSTPEKYAKYEMSKNSWSYLILNWHKCSFVECLPALILSYTTGYVPLLHLRIMAVVFE